MFRTNKMDGLWPLDLRVIFVPWTLSIYSCVEPLNRRWGTSAVVKLQVNRTQLSCCSFEFKGTLTFHPPKKSYPLPTPLANFSEKRGEILNPYLIISHLGTTSKCQKTHMKPPNVSILLSSKWTPFLSTSTDIRGGSWWDKVSFLCFSHLQTPQCYIKNVLMISVK